MKLASIVATTVALYGALATATADKMLTPTEALEAAKSASVTTGIAFTGTVEALQLPAHTDAKEANHEQWLGGGLGVGGFGGGLGVGGFGGIGGWGGFEGFGAYRFGFSCGGIGGWAYPLNYWNSFGAGLYGGGCGLGLASGNLFYC